MSGTPTAERILDSAMTLFAEKGYDGTGVDLIAELAGIKGPSLYRHYKGKEEILNALIERGEKHYEQNFGSGAHPGKMPESIEEMIAVSMDRIRYSVHDEEIKKFRRLLAMEQFRNNRIAALTTKHHMDGIVELYSRIFEWMMSNGLIRQEEPQELALEYIAPVTLLIHACDRSPEFEKVYMERIEKHLRLFMSMHSA